MSLFDVLAADIADPGDVYSNVELENLPPKVVDAWRSRIEHHAVNIAKEHCTDPTYTHISALEHALPLNWWDRAELDQIRTGYRKDDSGRDIWDLQSSCDPCSTYYGDSACLVLVVNTPAQAAWEARSLFTQCTDITESITTQAAVVMHGWLMEELLAYQGEDHVAV